MKTNFIFRILMIVLTTIALLIVILSLFDVITSKILLAIAYLIIAGSVFLTSYLKKDK